MSRLPRPIVPPPLPAERYDAPGLPVIVVNNPPPKPERPLSAFSLLAYVKAAILLLVFLGMAYCGWHAWRFVSRVSESIDASSSAQDAAEKNARKFALERLRPLGMVKIAKGAEFGYLLPTVTLSGLAADKDGKLHEFALVWRVAEFDGESRWEVQHAALDGVIIGS